MGNCFALCIPSKRRVLWVVKRDGKMIQFRGPILVKDVLVNFSGLGVGVSREALQHLPSDYELKIGKVYYLLPCPCSSGGSVSAPEVSSVADDGGQKGSGMKRIKVVITKQQLQDLFQSKYHWRSCCCLSRLIYHHPEIGSPSLIPSLKESRRRAVGTGHCNQTDFLEWRSKRTPFFSSAFILSFSQLSGSCRRVLYELKLLPDHESFSPSSFFCSPFITSKSSSTDTLTSSFDSPGISNRILISFSSSTISHGRAHLRRAGMPPSLQTSGPLRPSFGAWSSLERRGPTALEIEPNLCYIMDYSREMRRREANNTYQKVNIQSQTTRLAFNCGGALVALMHLDVEDASLFSPVASALTRASLERPPWREEGKKAEHGAPPPP
ncbi:hypothetical protein CK203_096198 [Vitis vinifera]|uniref:Uncharacterized protein n=1 Tax=Vitis vinifera TaxID=29760 RepID=A0A438CGL8_VITVI|nr:hypothetical protein CK203_096198 [Vitis vinifera]